MMLTVLHSAYEHQPTGRIPDAVRFLACERDGQGPNYPNEINGLFRCHLRHHECRYVPSTCGADGSTFSGMQRFTALTLAPSIRSPLSGRAIFALHSDSVRPRAMMMG